MARWERIIDIAAPAGVVWTVMSEVEKWPECTASILSIEDVTPGLGPGGSAVIRAAGAPRSRFTVTRREPGSGFDWETKTRGATAVAGHCPQAGGADACRATLSIEIGGVLAALFKPLIGRGIRRNLGMEAEGLKLRSEAGEARM